MMKIWIIGLGLIGGSLCKAIHEKTEHTVYGYDANEAVVAQACADGVIAGKGCAKDTFDMIIICLHERIAENVFHEILPDLQPGTILVDTCGLKENIVHDWTEACIPYGVRYVGTHPMAGREKSGYAASIPNLFQGANLIFALDEKTDDSAFQTVKSLAKEIGFGKIVMSTPHQHDNMIAYTSQLAHIVSSAYVKDDCMEDALPFSGGSFQDMTRVATMDEAMWSALFLDNRENLLYHLNLLLEHLADYRDAIQSKDETRLRQLILEGRKIQEENVRRKESDFE